MTSTTERMRNTNVWQAVRQDLLRALRGWATRPIPQRLGELAEW